MSIPAEIAAPDGVTSHLYRGRWWTHQGILLLNSMLGMICLTSGTNGFDGSMMNGLQATPQWASYFGEPKGATLGLYGAIGGIGALAASPVAPFVSDHFGRRSCVIFGCLCMLLATGLQACAQNGGMFIAARGLVGFGIGLDYVPSALLVAELAYPSQRATFSSLFNTMYHAGAIIAAITTLGTFRIPGTASWRIPSAMMAAVPILQLITIWFVPESPRWLVAQGREDDAVAVLSKYHAAHRGDINDELVQFEHKEIKRALRMELEASSGTSFLSLVATPGNRRRLRIGLGLVCFAELSGNNLLSYYLNTVLSQIGIGVTDKAQVQYFNLGLAVYNFLVGITGVSLVEMVGRRKLLLISNTGMLLAFILWTIGAGINAERPHGHAAARLVMAAIFIFNGFYTIAYIPLLALYPLEITPYRIRAKMIAVLAAATTSVLIFSLYVNPIALDKIGWKYYIVYVGWLVFELVFMWLYAVETKGLSLEETAVLFDGEEAVKEVKVHATRDTHTLAPDEKLNNGQEYVA